MFLVHTTAGGIRTYSENDPDVYHLCEWTQDGRNWQGISNWATALVVARGSLAAMGAAQSLLYPPAWEEHQKWRQMYYELTGRLLFLK